MTRNETVNLSTDAPKYTQKVLFGAQKGCSNPPGDPACYSVPQSSLPKDIYGHQTDRHSSGKYNRPSFMGSTIVMGRVPDLRPIFKLASELLEFEDVGKYGSQYIFSQIFGEQEYQRTLYHDTLVPKSRWREWLDSKIGPKVDPSITPPHMTIVPGKNYEFGIGLDYASSIFQVMNNSAEDIHSVRFDHPSIIASPSKLSSAYFKNPIHLPLDLEITPLPFSQHQVSAKEPHPPISALDNLPEENIAWAEVELATNVIVPGSSVPAMLNFHGSEKLLKEMWPEMWPEMWYQKYSRALMRQYIRSPDGPVAAAAAAQGGDQWWDLRGGKGGVWNERGEWREWMEVCAGTHDEVFMDGKGPFGMEDEKFGGEMPVYNSFGKILSGKERGKSQDELKEEEDRRIKDLKNMGQIEFFPLKTAVEVSGKLGKESKGPDDGKDEKEKPVVTEEKNSTLPKENNEDKQESNDKEKASSEEKKESIADRKNNDEKKDSSEEKKENTEEKKESNDDDKKNEHPTEETKVPSPSSDPKLSEKEIVLQAETKNNETEERQADGHGPPPQNPDPKAPLRTNSSKNEMGYFDIGNDEHEDFEF
jgi:hypothetical protein